MYGTVARLRILPGKEPELLEEVRAEDQEAHMPGYIHQFLYRLDAEPDTYYLVVVFDSRDTYVANAHSPEQHQRYLRLRTLLAADPEWHDGSVIYPPQLKRSNPMTTRTLDDYLTLPYTIEVIPDDGAWFVQVKELPGCMTEVDEWDEILPAIEDAKRLWIELALERGRPVPEPVGVVR